MFNTNANMKRLSPLDWVMVTVAEKAGQLLIAIISKEAITVGRKKVGAQVVSLRNRPCGVQMMEPVAILTGISCRF